MGGHKSWAKKLAVKPPGGKETKQDLLKEKVGGARLSCNTAAEYTSVLRSIAMEPEQPFNLGGFLIHISRTAARGGAALISEQARAALKSQ